MYSATGTFLEAVTRSHELAISVETLRNGLPVGEPITTTTAGTVTLDAKAAVRGRLDLTLTDDGTGDLVPTTPADRLAPYGNELRISRGLRYPDGTIEVIPLGVFRIDDADVIDDAYGLTIRIAGRDRSARIADSRFEEPGQVDQGTPILTAIYDVIHDAYPDVTLNFSTTSLTTPLLVYEEGGDRWQLAQDIAAGAAMRLYFDRDGELRLAPENTGPAVAALAEGDDGLLISTARKWTRRDAYNVWIVTGENTGEAAPARAVELDDDPESPTYVYGQFGRVPKFYTSQFIQTNDQAADVAAAMRDRELGTSESIDFGSLVLPHLDPGDVVRITRARAGIVAEDHVVDQLTIPLTDDGIMTASTRATRVLS